MQQPQRRGLGLWQLQLPRKQQQMPEHESLREIEWFSRKCYSTCPKDSTSSTPDACTCARTCFIEKFHCKCKIGHEYKSKSGKKQRLSREGLYTHMTSASDAVAVSDRLPLGLK